MKTWILVGAIALLGACSDDDSTSNNGNNTNNSNNSNNTNNSNDSNNSNNTNGSNNDVPPDECDDPSDCDGQICAQIGVAATYCLQEPDRRTVETCPTEDPSNECCADTDCTAMANGRCVSTMVGYCGGIQPPEINVCVYDQCQVGADCPDDQACALAGTFGSPVNVCIPALCVADSDCTDGEDGRCALLHSSDTCPDPVLGCTYKDDECRAVWDCPDNLLCVNGSCVQELTPP